MQEVWALKDVDFEIPRGESVGVIGRNGGGKSTLLQILTGVLAPTHGDVEVNGRVSALLELGSGFNPEYTGRDNVVLNGLLLGLSRREILRRFDEIVAFAEIGDALDRPVKTYSSGMLMRLAFAVQVLTDPEILVIDEALSVGDFFFQQKCFSHIRALCTRGATLLFVSHDMGAVRDLCSRCIVLRDGRLDFSGDKLEGIRRYLGSGASVSRNGAAPRHAVTVEGSRSLRIEQPVWTCDAAAAAAGHERKGRILSVGVFDASGRPVRHTRIGAELVFRVLFRAFTHEPLHVSIVLRNKYDQVVTVTGSYTLGTALPALSPNQEALFEVTVCPLIEAGNYSFSVSLGQAGDVGAGTIIDETPTLGPIEVVWDYQKDVPPFYGMVGLQSAARFVVANDG
jgi:lipopolysaccharide transport system ATP-binding protein